MHFQIALSALLFTSLFAIPAQAIEDDESKKKRGAKVEQWRESGSHTQKKAECASKAYADAEREDFPADHYKNLDLKSF